MKILHVCESLIGGPASYLEEVLPYQVEQFGAENVALLAPASQRDSISSSISCVVETYSRSGRDPFSLLALASAIRKSIKHHRPDVVHLHSSIAGAVGRWIIHRMRERPYVIYCAHCWAFDRPQRTPLNRLWALIERRLSSLADVIVNISPHEEALLRRAGFSLKNTRLIVSGITDLKSAPATRLSSARKSSDPLRLLFVGRLDLQKGIDLLLRDFAMLKPGRATLKVVGAKIVDNYDLTIPPDVEFLGWVPRETLPDMFEQSDAVVMPSRWEGMPLLAIEALRSGCPLICTNRGAFPHFIKDGVNGVLMDIDAPGSLGKALTILEGSDRAIMSVAARATFVAKFQRERMNYDLVELYEDLMQTGSQSNVALAPRPQQLEKSSDRRVIGGSR
jgi:glycosyltransferase involved in cell wall biosynthesis